MSLLPDKLPTESAKAYAAFMAYAEMGGSRSLDRLLQQYNKNASYKRQLGEWSTQHAWQKRVADYDRTIAQERADILAQGRKADIEALRTTALDDAGALRALARVLRNKLAKRIATLDEAEISVKEIAPLLRALSVTQETATNLEATAFGVTDMLKVLDDLDARKPAET